MQLQTIFSWMIHNTPNPALTPIRISNNTLFSTGALIRHGSMGDTTVEPPTDPFLCARARLFYAQTKLQRVEADFADLKSAAGPRPGPTWHWPSAEYGPPPSDRDPHFGLPCPVAALNRLAVIAAQRREFLAQCEAEVEALTPKPILEPTRSSSQHHAQIAEIFTTPNGG